MTLLRSLAFALCFVIILALTIRLEHELTKNDRLKMDLSAQALQLNDRIRQEANIHSLVQKAAVSEIWYRLITRLFSDTAGRRIF